ncbi:MAG: phosphoadenylyl-sulfate reductase [Actinomycetota bacterium]
MVPNGVFASPDSGYQRLERAHPRDILAWAALGIDRLAVATSFQSSGLVILHMLRELRPDVPVLFLETGFHFQETLAFKDQIAELWDLKLVELRGAHGSPEHQAEQYGSELYKRDPHQCCFINKVAPLQEALEEYDGWISGLRRDQSPLRVETPIVEAQMLPSGNEVLKLHPLASWSREEVSGYIDEHAIPTHPLLERGFASIGCRPCTRAVSDFEDDRAGRWDGLAKTECGIHSFGTSSEAEQ